MSLAAKNNSNDRMRTRGVAYNNSSAPNKPTWARDQSVWVMNRQPSPMCLDQISANAFAAAFNFFVT